MSLATLALVVLSWGKQAPVPAPEPSPLDTVAQTLLAVCVCWLLPLVLLKLTAASKHDLALERLALQRLLKRRANHVGTKVGVAQVAHARHTPVAARRCTRHA